MNINIQSYIAGSSKGRTSGSALGNIRSIRIPATISIFLVVCLLIFSVSPSAYAASSAYDAVIYFRASSTGSSWTAQYNHQLDNFVWPTLYKYIRIDKIVFPAAPNEDNTGLSGNLYFNIHIGGITSSSDVQSFTMEYSGGNINTANTTASALPSYTVDYSISGHKAYFPMIPDGAPISSDLIYTTNTVVISGVVGILSNHTVTISFNEPIVLAFNLNGSISNARPYFIFDSQFYPTYYDWFFTINHNMLQLSSAVRDIYSSLGSLGNMVESLDSITSDVAQLRDLSDEHSQMQHEIQDQMTGAWDSYKSGASSGSDALEELDLSSVAQYNPDVVEPALNNGGLLDWFTPACHDSLRPNSIRGQGTDVLNFMDEWYDEFYRFLGGGKDG